MVVGMYINNNVDSKNIFNFRAENNKLYRQNSVISEKIGDYGINTDSNVFLKQYLENRAKAKNINIPEGMEILVSAPENYSKEFKKNLGYISNKIYCARVVDLFNLLEKDFDSVSERVEKMKISEDDKQKLLQLKSQIDNYYKIEVKYNNKKYNLLNLNEDEKNELKKISPEFADFIEEESPLLQKHSGYFARKEVSKIRLDNAGHNSAVAAGGLFAILSFLVGKGVFDSRVDANLLKENKAKFLKNQAEIFNEGAPKFENPFKEFIEAGKNGFTKKAAKNPKKVVLSALLLTTLAGAADDLMGCVKDSIQDTDNFGIKTGLGINIPSAIFGVLTSMAIAPMIEGEILYKRSAKYLNKYKNELNELGINVKNLENAKRISNIVKHGGKIAVMATAVTMLTQAFKGIITAMSSSGSSWGSMAGTRLVMENGGKKLENKNIITKEENTFKNTTDNMMAYEAYKGKWTGISRQDPLIGTTGGVLGLFTHVNPYVQSLAFGLQGCSETLTACYYQVTGAKDRKDVLLKEKNKLIQDAMQKA